MSRITLTLDEELAAKLREAAKQDDRPMSSVARIAFTNYFASLPQSKPSTAKKGGRK